MVFYIYVETQDLFVIEYKVTMEASYSEIEAASKSENFISWVVENATDIDPLVMSDMTSNDFIESFTCNGDKKLCLYYIAPKEAMELLPPIDYEY